VTLMSHLPRSLPFMNLVVYCLCMYSIRLIVTVFEANDPCVVALMGVK
jgi:hypothetical protein